MNRKKFPKPPYVPSRMDKDEMVQARELREKDFTQTHLATIFAGVNIPARTPKNPFAWTRTNGRQTLIIQGGIKTDEKTGKVTEQIPVPAGIIPRRILVFLSHQWKLMSPENKKTRKIYLGSCVAEFMTKIGCDRGGKTYKEIQEQIKRLFSARISLQTHIPGALAMEHAEIAKKFIVWWDVKKEHENQSTILASHVIISEELAEALENSMPVALEILEKIGGDCMLFDLYCWLSLRHYNVAKPVQVSWEQLKLQFGCDYKSMSGFRFNFLKAFAKLKEIVPFIKSVPNEHGILLMRSPDLIEPVQRGDNKKAADKYITEVLSEIYAPDNDPYKDERERQKEMSDLRDNI